MYRFDIKRKSDGKITHSLQGDKVDGVPMFMIKDKLQAEAPKSWGDPDDYDLIETDISDELDYLEKSLQRSRATRQLLDDFLEALLDNDNAKLGQLRSEWAQIKADHPVPPRPPGLDR